MKNEKLTEAVKDLCNDLQKVHTASFPRIAKYNNYTAEAGRKFIKIICQNTFNGDMSESVWGFINIAEFSKDRKMAAGIKTVTFREGDVLMSQGWKAPALNSARGNLLDGYPVTTRNQHGPAYLI